MSLFIPKPSKRRLDWPACRHTRFFSIAWTLTLAAFAGCSEESVFPAMRSLAGSASSVGPLDDESVLRGLQIISTMDESLEDMFSLEDGAREDIDKELVSMSRSFWTEIYNVDGAMTARDPDDLTSSPALTLEEMISADMQVVTLIFAAEDAPLRPHASAIVVAHAFNSLFDRVKATIPFHDLATEVADGFRMDASELSDIINVFASLAHQGRLVAALQEAQHLRASWRSAFCAISARHERFFATLAGPLDARQEDGLLSAGPSDPLSKSSMRLINMVQQAKLWQRNKEMTGMYTQSGPKEIVSGFEPQRVDGWVREADMRTKDL